MDFFLLTNLLTIVHLQHEMKTNSSIKVYFDESLDDRPGPAAGKPATVED
jgi:hypothetical protein